VAAIILGHIAKKEIRESNNTISGSGMATAGLVLGYIQWAFILLGVVVLVVILSLVPNISNSISNFPTL
jgi:hypothetical protein